MKIKINKNLNFIYISLVILITLTGCTTNKTNNTGNLTQNTPKYLPVVQLWKGKSKSIQTIVDNIHSVQFQDGWIVAEVPNNNLIVSSPAHNNHSKYPDGLYTVDSKSGNVTPLFHLNPNKNEQIYKATANEKWLVYELGTYTDSQATSSLYAYNWATKKSYKIYTVPNGFDCPAEPSGLYIEGDKCFWSNYIENKTSHECISEIHDYSLAEQKDDILLQLIANQTSNTNDFYKNGVIFSSSVEDGKVVFSLHQGGNYMDNNTGDIYEIDLKSKQVSHLLNLYHSACSISANDGKVVMNMDYNKTSKDVVNPAPYPVYLYTKGDKKLYQLLPNGNQWFPTQNKRFIAWDGDNNQPQVYDLVTGTYYCVPGVATMIIGNYITWQDSKAGTLNWAQLPK